MYDEKWKWLADYFSNDVTWDVIEKFSYPVLASYFSQQCIKIFLLLLEVRIIAN